MCFSEHVRTSYLNLTAFETTALTIAVILRFCIFFYVDLWKSGLNNQYVYHLNLDISEEMIVGNNDGMHVILRLIT